MEPSRIIMKDADQNAYVYWVYPIGTPFFRDVGGCYAFTRQDDDGWFIAYIGQTESLAGRLEKHAQFDLVKKHAVTHIAVRVNGSKIGREREEEALVNFYKPPCNETSLQAQAA